MALSSLITLDCHTHILPETLPDFSAEFGYGEFVRLQHHAPQKAWMYKGFKKFREINANCWDPAIRIEEMKDHGIDMQIICTIPVMFSYWAKPADGLRISQFLNDHIAQLFTQYPQHFIGLATVPMQNTELAVRELERCKQLGFKGVQIGSNVNQLNLNAPEFQNFFAACEALNLSVLIHPWEMMGQEHMEQYWLPWLVGMPAEITRALCSFIFGGLFDRYPKLRVCFAHGGGNFIGTLGRLEHGWSCRPDLVAIDNPNPPSSYLGRFWVDSHVCDSEQLTLLVKKLGADKVIQGSDYPFPLGESSPGHLVRNSGLNESVQNSIFNNAPKAWLGI